MKKGNGVKTVDFADGALSTSSVISLHSPADQELLQAARTCALHGEDAAEVAQFLDMLDLAETVRAMRAG